MGKSQLVQLGINNGLSILFKQINGLIEIYDVLSTCNAWAYKARLVMVHIDLGVGGSPMSGRKHIKIRVHSISTDLKAVCINLDLLSNTVY